MKLFRVLLPSLIYISAGNFRGKTRIWNETDDQSRRALVEHSNAGNAGSNHARIGHVLNPESSSLTISSGTHKLLTDFKYAKTNHVGLLG